MVSSRVHHPVSNLIHISRPASSEERVFEDKNVREMHGHIQKEPGREIHSIPYIQVFTSQYNHQELDLLKEKPRMETFL